MHVLSINPFGPHRCRQEHSCSSSSCMECSKFGKRLIGIPSINEWLHLGSVTCLRSARVPCVPCWLKRQACVTPPHKGVPPVPVCTDRKMRHICFWGPAPNTSDMQKGPGAGPPVNKLFTEGLVSGWHPLVGTQVGSAASAAPQWVSGSA